MRKALIDAEMELQQGAVAAQDKCKALQARVLHHLSITIKLNFNSFSQNTAFFNLDWLCIPDLRLY